MTNTPTLVLVHAASASVPVVGEPFSFADADAPQINVMDLSVTRGDGIFETASVVDSHVQALQPHLARFARSAEILDLPTPDLDVWTKAILAGVEHFKPGHEAFAKFIMTRGVEGSGVPSGWVYVADAEDFTRERTEGIDVVTLSRGYSHSVAHDYPWLLQGAKTLSYAVHKSVLREAARRGSGRRHFHEHGWIRPRRAHVERVATVRRYSRVTSHRPGHS